MIDQLQDSTVLTSVTCSLTKRDIFNSRLFFIKRMIFSPLIVGLVAANMIILGISMRDEHGEPMPLDEALLAMICFVLILVVVGAVVLTLLAYVGARVTKLESAERKYEVRSEGLFMEDENQVSLTRWSSFERIIRKPNMIYLFLLNRNALIIPMRAFERSDQADLFCLRVKEQMESVKS